MVGAIPDKVTLNRNEPWNWPSNSPTNNSQSNPFAGRKATLYVLNPADVPAKLEVSGVIREEFPQVAVVPFTAAGVVGLVLFYLLLRLVRPR